MSSPPPARPPPSVPISASNASSASVSLPSATSSPSLVPSVPTVDPSVVEIEVEEVTDAALLRKQREVQALLAWANTFLAKRSLHATSLYQFDDGVLLINLLEVSFHEIVNKYNTRPKSNIHKLENVSIAFDTMKRIGIVLVSIDGHAIVGRKDKQITQVLWNILRYHLLSAIRDPQTSEKGAPSSLKQTIKDKLLLWCKQTFADQPNIEISDFWESFKSGVALSAIVNKLHPNAIDVQTISTKDPQGNLSRAIKAAEQYLGIPALLDAEDFKSAVPDETTVINYLSMLLSASLTTAKAKEITDRLSAEKAAKEMEAQQDRKMAQEKQEEINRLKDHIIELKVSIQQGEVKQEEWKEKYERKCSEKETVEKKVKEVTQQKEEEKRASEVVYVNIVHEKTELVTKVEEQKGEIQKWKAMLEKMTDTAQITKALADDETKKREEEKRQHEDEIDHFKQIIEELKTRIAAMEKDHEESTKRREEEIKGLNDSLFQSHEKHRADQFDWNTQKGKMESEIQEKENRIDELNGDKNNLQSVISQKQDDIQQLRSEVYGLHTELEELVARVRKEEKEKMDQMDREEKYSDKKMNTVGTDAKRIAAPKDMTNPKFLVDALEGMKAFGGLLMRRRPFAVFNSTRFKQVYFRIRGEILEWGKDDKHIKNHVKLKDYVPGQVKSTTAGQFMFRLTPVKSEGNVVFDFMAPADVSDPTDKYIKSWIYQINRRITLIEYLSNSNEKKLPVADFVNFICDDRLQSLSVKEIIHGVPEALHILNPALKYRNNLKKVELCNCNLEDKDIENVASLLQENSNVLYVDLSHNLMTETGTSSLSSVLAQKNQTLKSLVLDANQLKDEGCKRIAAILPLHSKLSELSLNSNQITDLGVISLCNELLASEKKNNGQIHVFPDIRLRGNKIGDKGGEAIALLLKRNFSVKSITLENNALGDVGAIAILKTISDQPPLSSHSQTPNRLQLNSINFASNHLSTKACIAIADVLKATSSSLSLDLSHNKLISRQGMKALVSVDVAMDYPLLKVVKQSADGDDDEEEGDKKDKTRETFSAHTSAAPSAAASREPSVKKTVGDNSESPTPEERSRKGGDEDDENKKK